jgi:DNA repair protein RadD
MKRFNKLVEDGYLSKLKTIATNIELDVTGIKTQNGDFAKTDMSSAFDREPITNAAIDEIIRVGADYKKWLIFAIDIDHAEHIAETLIRKGVPTSVIHSKMDEDRDHILKRSKEGFFKALVNVNVLTTGYDDPEIDLIAILRPTKSPVIHVQTIGRGLRVMPGKDHCVVLDFAGNTERLGPINSMTVKEKRKGKGGEPITKRCPTCDTIHHPAVRKCEFCGWEFEFKHGLGNSSGNDVVASDRPLWHKVDEISYYKHEKPNRPPMVKVAYKCGLQFYNEFVCPEHPGWAGMRGRNWIEYRGGKGFTVDEAMKEAEGYKRPNKILVNTKTKYPSIDDYSF